ncbi:MAG: hypothetical protein PVG78_06015 [Desulfobacterales bacterium]|jgi:hypothetical protein
MDFYCPEKKCPSTGRDRFVLSLPDEACMDERNMADVFCPHCGNSLVRKESVVDLG